MNSVQVAGYKINIEKAVASLYSNNKLSERDIKKMIPFTSASKRIKPRNKYNQECKDLYLENYDTDERN